MFQQDGIVGIRESIYPAIGLEETGDSAFVRTYHCIFNILLRHEHKLDAAIKKKPNKNYEYISPYYDIRLSEYERTFNSKQNDCIGLFLFKVGDLHSRGHGVIRNQNDRRLLKKLVLYLAAIEYWHDPDNGMWGTEEEVHASSVGVCAAGLSEVRTIVDVPKWLIVRGLKSLNNLLPRECSSRKTDMALLSLIYPCNIVYADQQKLILRRIEDDLVRERGLIRFENDKEGNLAGIESEFPMGFAWLAAIYKKLRMRHKQRFYTEKLLHCANEGKFPQYFYGNTKLHSDMYPCGSTHALFNAIEG